MVAVLIRPAKEVARIGCDQKRMDDATTVAIWSARLSAAPSGIRVSASHYRTPIASSIELMRAKSSSSGS